MISASQEFNDAAKSDYRDIRVYVDVLWTDPNVSSGITVSSPHSNSFVYNNSSVIDAINLNAADSVLSTPYKYVINDGTWINDGSFHFCPGTTEESAYAQVGWYSAEVCDGPGTNPQEVTVNFSSTRSIDEIIVCGEPTLGEYPVDFSVYIYDSIGTVLNSITDFTGTTVETILDFIDDNIIDAKSMKLVIRDWSASNTICKIVEFFGVVTDRFTQDDITYIDILEEAESNIESLPYGVMSSNELRIGLQNIDIERNGSIIVNPYIPENYNSYLAYRITQNIRFKPYIGFRLPSGLYEYIKMGTFWSTEMDSAEGMFDMEVIARDRLYLLSKNPFRQDEIFINKSLAYIAEYILNRAKIEVPLNDLKWSISSDLENFTVGYAYIGGVSYFEALSKVCSACFGRCYSNRDDEIVLETYLADIRNTNEDIEFTTENDIFDIKRPMQDLINVVKCKYYTVYPTTEDEVLFYSDEITFTTGVTEITQYVEYENDGTLDHSVQIEYIDTDVVVLCNPVHYPWGSTITFLRTGAEGSFKFKVLGKKLVIDNYKTVTIPEVLPTDSTRLYGKQVHEVPENILIQSESMAISIAYDMLASMQDTRRDCVINVGGNPALEVGDTTKIEVYSKLSASDYFRVIRQHFKLSSESLRCEITGIKTINYGN